MCVVIQWYYCWKAKTTTAKTKIKSWSSYQKNKNKGINILYHLIGDSFNQFDSQVIGYTGSYPGSPCELSIESSIGKQMAFPPQQDPDTPSTTSIKTLLNTPAKDKTTATKPTIIDKKPSTKWSIPSTINYESFSTFNNFEDAVAHQTTVSLDMDSKEIEKETSALFKFLDEHVGSV